MLDSRSLKEFRHLGPAEEWYCGCEPPLNIKRDESCQKCDRHAPWVEPIEKGSLRPDAPLTVGEQLLGRELVKEKRAGVEHYVPGQHAAVIYRGIDYATDRPCEVGRVTYVDAVGHACVVLTFRFTDAPDEWLATWIGRAGQKWKSEARKVNPGEFTLSANALAALAEAPYEETNADA